MDSIICIVLGMLFANGVPHFVKGITAERWDVPWKNQLLPPQMSYGE